MASEDNNSEKLDGAIYQSLSRSNKQIKAERGDAIAEDLEMTFKREVEDIERLIKRKNREKINMIDFSPTNTQSLVMAKDLDADSVKEKILALGLETRNLNIKLENAKDEYEFMFGTKL